MPAPASDRALRVLALEPYFGGSHRQFLEQWRGRSRHRFDCLTLDARWWKWRMRGAAVDLAREIRARTGPAPDVVVCSDMLNVAELRGLSPPAVAQAPHVLFMHESQLTYPHASGRPAEERARDHHFAMTNVVSVIASDEVWFNSEYHREAFYGAAEELARRLPDGDLHTPLREASQRSHVEHLGVQDAWADRWDTPRPGGPARIGWVGRWEHDKAPEVFFDAMEALLERGVALELFVLGERFRQQPDCFERFRARHPEVVAQWGPLPRSCYEAALARLDLVVSTARHEFFGVAVVEAMLAGAVPVLPCRLSYPELLGRASAGVPVDDPLCGLYGDQPTALVDRLAKLVELRSAGALAPGSARAAALRFSWERRGPELDLALERAAGGGPRL